MAVTKAILLPLFFTAMESMFSAAALVNTKRRHTTMLRRVVSLNETDTSTACHSEINLGTGFEDTRGEEYQGIMFDVGVPVNKTSEEDVHIYAFDINMDGDNMHQIQVYTRLGTHVGYEDDSESWTDLGIYVVDGKGAGLPTRLELNSPVLGKPGEVLAFYLAQLDGDEFKALDRRREGVGSSLSSNSTLEIFVGTAKEEESDPFEHENEEGVGFSGTIYYRLCGSSTPRPTMSPTIAPTARPTIFSEEFLMLSENFMLKMFWEEGMEWQESSDEKAWCAERKSDKIEIEECDDGNDDQRWYYFQGQIKPLEREDRCLEHSSKHVSLESCNGSVDQKWAGLRSRSRGKFQLKPANDFSKCLTQQHHPKGGELLFVYDCEVAEFNDEGKYDDTSHWVIGIWDGHP